MGTEIRKSTDLDDYLFDLRGYLILKNVVSPATLHAMNAWLDLVPPDIEPNSWHGDVHCQEHSPKFGMNLQQA